MSSILKKVRRDGLKETLRAVKVNVFWQLEEQILFHAPILLPLAFRKPRFLYLELTNDCNLACEMCIRYGNREAGYMGHGLFKRLIDEAASMGGVSLSFHFSGESTIHPQFKGFLSYALSKKKRFYKMSLTTNGMCFDNDVAKLALNLDWVTFSVDGVGPVNERIRKGSDYKRIEQNILHFLYLRGERQNPIISTNTVITTQSREELEEMQKVWSRRGVNVNYSGCIDKNFHIIPNHNYEGYVNPKWIRTHTQPICFMPWSDLAVTWDGMVHFCCHNLQGSYPIGSAYYNSLMELWKGKRLNRIRRMLVSKIRPKGEICYYCKKR